MLDNATELYEQARDLYDRLLDSPEDARDTPLREQLIELRRRAAEISAILDDKEPSSMSREDRKEVLGKILREWAEKSRQRVPLIDLTAPALDHQAKSRSQAAVARALHALSSAELVLQHASERRAT